MKKLLIMAGVAALVASPAFAGNLDTANDQFVDEPTQFVDGLDKFGASDDVEPGNTLGTPAVKYDNGIVKQDVRLPRIEDPRPDRNRVQAYDITDPNSVYNNQNVVDDKVITRDIVTRTHGEGKRVGRVNGGKGVAAIRGRGFIKVK